MPESRVTKAEEGSKPVPDPTELTTSQLRREIMMLRELIDSRLDGNDEAVTLLRTTTDKFPASIKDAMSQLQELHEEKFSSIATQFQERDTRTEQTIRDSKVAVDAALQAAKEAVGEQNKSNALAIAKSEAAFTKQIDQIGIIIQTMAKGLDDKIDDMKGRITTIESRPTSKPDMGIYFVAGLALLVAVAVLVIVLMLRHG